MPSADCQVPPPIAASLFPPLIYNPPVPKERTGMRGVPRWVAVLAVVATGAVVCAFTVRRAMAPATLVLRLSQGAIPADGFTSTELRISPSNGRELRGLQVTVEDPHRAAVESVTVEGRHRDCIAACRGLAWRDQGSNRRSRIRVAGDRATDDALTTATRSATALRTSCACTMLPTALRFPPLVYLAGGSAVFPRTSASGRD